VLRKSWSHPIPLERGSGRPPRGALPWGEASFSWRSGAPHPSCAVCAQRIHAQHGVFEASLASRFRSGGYGRGCQQSDDRKGQLKALPLCTQVTNPRTQGTHAHTHRPHPARTNSRRIACAHVCCAACCMLFCGPHRTAPHRTARPVDSHSRTPPQRMCLRTASPHACPRS
jgi:hypothetical protein